MARAMALVAPEQTTTERPDGAEEMLASRAAAGDPGAFDALVALFTGRVFAVAFRMLGDRAEAEDLSQEVFVALYHSLGTFRGESRLSTWIYRITKNRCLNRIKFLKRRRVGDHADIDDPLVQRGVADPGTGDGADRDPVRRMHGDRVAAVVEERIRALPDEQRLLVVLRDVEDLSYEEIVEVTGLPLGTVKSRLHRARAELAKQLEPLLSALEPAP
jgi:RNA polymerase sigma-70 factor, ECF subfamily